MGWVMTKDKQLELLKNRLESWEYELSIKGSMVKYAERIIKALKAEIEALEQSDG